MKTKILYLMILSVMLCFSSGSLAQSSSKGFDYGAHHRMNKKAGRWGERRLKASDHDQVNLKCSVRKSRRYTKKPRN